MQCWEGPPPQGSPRHGGAVRCFANIPTDTDPPRGRPVGGGGGSSQIIWNYKHSITHISLVQFNMENALGISILCACGRRLRVCFHGKPSHYFSQRSFWATAHNAPASAAVASPLERYTSEKVIRHNRKERRGGSGDRHCPLRKIDTLQFVENFWFL